MADRPVIGFIGVGLMGHGMAKNILAGGYPLQVRGNRDRAPVDSLVGLGATEAQSPAAMARDCDMVFLCLSNSAQVEAVIEGPEGLLDGARKGLIVIDTTTADPVSTRRLAARLAESGAAMVDAPLGRTPKEAEAGTLDAMVGCDADLFDMVRPVIDCWAGSVTRIGETGAGHTMKLIMNFISMGYAAMYSEAFVLAAKAGVAPATVRDVIGASRLGNGFFDTFTRYAVDRDRDAHKFSIRNGSKDLGYVNALAGATGTVNLLGAAARHYFVHAEAVGGADDYVPMLSDHVARLNGIDLAKIVAGED